MISYGRDGSASGQLALAYSSSECGYPQEVKVLSCVGSYYTAALNTEERSMEAPKTFEFTQTTKSTLKVTFTRNWLGLERLERARSIIARDDLTDEQKQDYIAAVFSPHAYSMEVRHI